MKTLCLIEDMTKSHIEEIIWNINFFCLYDKNLARSMYLNVYSIQGIYIMELAERARN